MVLGRDSPTSTRPPAPPQAPRKLPLRGTRLEGAAPRNGRPGLTGRPAGAPGPRLGGGAVTRPAQTTGVGPASARPPPGWGAAAPAARPGLRPRPQPRPEKAARSRDAQLAALGGLEQFAGGRAVKGLQVAPLDLHGEAIEEAVSRPWTSSGDARGHPREMPEAASVCIDIPVRRVARLRHATRASRRLSRPRMVRSAVTIRRTMASRPSTSSSEAPSVTWLETVQVPPRDSSRAATHRQPGAGGVEDLLQPGARRRAPAGAASRRRACPCPR